MDTTTFLGASSLDGEPTPTLLDVLADVRIEYVDCGGIYTTAIDEEGNGYIWGKNYFVAERLKKMKNIVSCSAGANHAGFVSKDGTLRMTGSSTNAQMARLGSVMDSLNEIHEVPERYFPGKVQSVHCGERYTLVLVDLDPTKRTNAQVADHEGADSAARRQHSTDS